MPRDFGGNGPTCKELAGEQKNFKPALNTFDQLGYRTTQERADEQLRVLFET